MSLSLSSSLTRARKGRRLVPAVEGVERRLLLTIAYFQNGGSSNILLDTVGDPTGHTAWGFPGMNFSVVVSSPANTGMGWHTITYTFASGVLDLQENDHPPNKTIYTPGKGDSYVITSQ